jgi:outer membrane receptor for ferric coprogen and ferric-rhodotorulic acid
MTFQPDQRGAMWGATPLYYTDGSRIDFARSANYAPRL